MLLLSLFYRIPCPIKLQQRAGVDKLFLIKCILYLLYARTHIVTRLTMFKQKLNLKKKKTCMNNFKHYYIVMCIF